MANNVPWDIVKEILSYSGQRNKPTFCLYITKFEFDNDNYEFSVRLRIDKEDNYISEYHHFRLRIYRDHVDLFMPNDDLGVYYSVESSHDIDNLVIKTEKLLPHSFKGIPLSRVPGISKMVDIVQKNFKEIPFKEMSSKIEKEVPGIIWDICG